jgi:hypothetical protein
VDLHCSPPANKLQHGLAVTGRSSANVILAIIEALVKLTADIPDVEAALRRDATNDKCPDDPNCKRKTIGKRVIWRGVSFDIGFDAKTGDWHCTIGVAAELDVLCEPEVSG